MPKFKLDAHISPCTKPQLKLIKIINSKTKPLNLQHNKIRILEDTGVCRDYEQNTNCTEKYHEESTTVFFHCKFAQQETPPTE